MHGRASEDHRVRQRWQPRHRVVESRATVILEGTHESARTRLRRVQRRQEHARYASVRETLRQLMESDYCKWLRRQGTRAPQLDQQGTHKGARLTLHESIVLFGTPPEAQRQGDAPLVCPSDGPSVPAVPMQSAGSIVTSCLELRSSSHLEAGSSADLHDALRPLSSESLPTLPENIPIPQAPPLQACCSAPVLADSLAQPDTWSAWARLLQDTDSGLACGPAPDSSAARVDHSLVTDEPVQD